MANLERFKDAVNYWQQAYGLHEYSIIVCEGQPGVPTNCTVEVKYLRATIDVDPELGDDDIEHAACHEVAHVFLGEFAHNASDVLGYFAGAHRTALDDAWHRAWWRTAERLARVMESKGA